MLPSAIPVTGVHAPSGGSMADYQGRFGSMLQGTRGIKRPAGDMTGPIPGAGNRIASNDTYDNRAVKTVPYAIQVTGRNVPGTDYRSDYMPMFVRDASVFGVTPDHNTVFDADQSMKSVRVGGLFNTPYKTSMQAFSLCHMNMILSALESEPGDRKAYNSAQKVLEGFSYAGMMINQQSGDNRFGQSGMPSESDNSEYSREKQINVAKWGQTTSHALWGHDAIPGQSLWLIMKRFPRAELTKNGLDMFNIRPDSLSQSEVKSMNPAKYPFQWVAWKGDGAPSIFDTHYVDPDQLFDNPSMKTDDEDAVLRPGAVIYVGDFEYSIESGTTKQFKKATVNARIAADTGLTKMTVYPGGIKFNF